jgi:hypothetical protein
MAMEDGYTLAQAVVRPEGGALLEEEDLYAALAAWRKTRHKKALLTQEASEYVSKACKAYHAQEGGGGGGGGGGFLKSLLNRLAPFTVENKVYVCLCGFCVCVLVFVCAEVRTHTNT